MKIEKVSDNQIRCTLTAEDLESRSLRLSELAYGTEKAKDLFRDMMKEADRQFGFKADNTPLMIEAVPVTSNSIVLIITKVDDPEELDTRFSKFTPSPDGMPEEDIQIAGADDVIDALHKIADAKTKNISGKKKKAPETAKASTAKKEEPPVDLVRLFLFTTIDNVIHASEGLGSFYNGSNSLYRLKKNGTYLLVVHQSSLSPEDFNKVCNILSEYGTGQPYSQANEAHLTEHEEAVIKKRALQQLRELV